MRGDAAAVPRPQRRDVVTGGVPLPAGLCHSLDDVSVVDAAGAGLPLQLSIVERWPDQSLRWLLLDLLADAPAACRLRLFSGVRPPPPPDLLAIAVDGDEVTVRAAGQTFVVAPGESLFATTDRRGQRLAPQVIATDAMATTTRAMFTRVAVERSGPLLAVVLLEGSIAIADAQLTVVARLRFTAAAVVQIELSILNPRAAVHPGNVWELGDPGSVQFTELSVQVAVPSPAVAVSCIAEPGLAAVNAGELTLYQDSSGGDHWRSPVHRNRDGRVPARFNGYRLEGPAAVSEGRRSSPAMELSYDGGTVAAAVGQFWQNFPKGLSGTAAGLTIGLFPPQWDDLHELQGGERKTHAMTIAFESRFPDALSPAFEPAEVAFEPEWYARCEVVPALRPSRLSQERGYEELIGAALDGADTFAVKRERIDEYGWRNFGDIYADHEAIGHQGAVPLVSHYNNQYDAVAGFAIQFMRSGDRRWFSAMDELADHVGDIDLYHTDHDKSAFSHGLFWHTAHYLDAGRSTHRTYPGGAGVSGGPSNEHDYSTGLLLHYLLTGSPRSREAVLELVQWVEAMDDGTRTVFRFLSRGHTGLASSTVSPGYHGPGRGAGNSIATLLNGFRLTQQRRWLTQAEALIRRCIHPSDEVEGRGLLDAEQRWSYTVFLQTLGKYLQVKRLLGELDQPYEYARQSLVHYGHWMAAHEYPYLDRPERLEHPNETWAAQDLRKADIFALVATYGAEPDRERMLERSRFFFAHSIATLAASDTRTLTRPVVILLSNGHNITGLQEAATIGDEGLRVAPFGPPTAFVPQKVTAKRRAMFVAALAATILTVAILCIVLFFLA